MCHPVNCRVCGKTTWAGCGHHIDAVQARVPTGQWCDGRHSAEQIAAAPNRGGVFGRLFGR